MHSRVQLSDTRRAPRTLEEADLLLRDIALATCRINKSAAEAEAAIADIKARHTAAVARDKAAVAVMEAQLTAFIDIHRDLFTKPKSRKTEFGSYGLRTATKLEVADPGKVYRYAIKNGEPDLCVVSYKVSNRAATALIKGGAKIPGATLSTGEIAGYKLNLDVAENALNGGAK